MNLTNWELSPQQLDLSCSFDLAALKMDETQQSTFRILDRKIRKGRAF